MYIEEALKLWSKTKEKTPPNIIKPEKVRQKPEGFSEKELEVLEDPGVDLILNAFNASVTGIELSTMEE